MCGELRGRHMLSVRSGLKRQPSYFRDLQRVLEFFASLFVGLYSVL